MAVVLIADDDDGVRSLACLILRSAGHEVIGAANGLEAVSLFRFAPKRIDIVVTDLVMPVMDGYEVVRLVRETRPDARIICISGAGEKPVPAGVVFLGKPFRPETLRDLVKQACG